MSRYQGSMKKFVWILFLLAVAGFSAGLGTLTVVTWQVFFGDDTALRKTTILAKIKEETTLYYLDEETRIGSIFEANHRRYVPIDEVPPFVVNAIVAAEDQSFYDHIGIDPVAILKAVGEGILAGGHFRRGGSTITQQTVKNIMDDWEASFARKFREMIKALQLERLYTKRQILEFYLNQFHVAGNGNGIGIAAKYYFNKPVQDLTLVEAAFIAGSVKGPSKYNPFIKYTKKTKERAIAAANTRKNYVLRRMFEQHWISEEEYKESLEATIPFNRGEFRSSEVALVNLVKAQLQKKEILEALDLDSYEDLNVAGMKVFTTLDADFQKHGQLAMRRSLSRLETILQGYKPEKEEKYKPLRHLKVEEFYYGKVEKVLGKSIKDMSIKLSFGLPVGTIPNDAIRRYAKLLDLSEGRTWQYQAKQLRKKIKPGDVIFVEVKGYEKESHEAILEMQKRPTISGGFIAIEKGEVRGVISGFDTLGFNRAMHAKRQPGSVFKSVVFYGAMQLGWSMLDRIDNGRQIYPFQGQFYYPRPDHASPYKSVSMLWTGIMSENLATITLGSRLLDKLNFAQFKELMSFMGLMPEPGESERDYHYRVARTTGVSLDNKGIKEFQLQNAIKDITPDLIFSGSQRELQYLQKMWWGEGYLAEFKNNYRYEKGRHKNSIKEMGIRASLIKTNFLRYEEISKLLVEDWNFIVQKIEEKNVEEMFEAPEMQEILKNFRVLSSSNGRPALAYVRQFEGEEIPEAIQGDDRYRLSHTIGRPLNVLDAEAIWGRSGGFGSSGSANITLSDVKIEGKVTLKNFVRIRQYIENRFKSIKANSGQYDLFRYYQHHDFRIAVGLNYLVKLAKAMGVYSKLEPVLSFGLGTNVVSVGEVAKIYQTLQTGKTYRFFDKGPDNQLTFIRRIEDRYGNVLYESDRKEHQLSTPETSLQMREILRRIITHGTGRRARGELYVTINQAEGAPNTAQKSGEESEFRVRVPAFGKTGTTNDFTTSYFAGFLPSPRPNKKSSTLDPEHGYTLAGYVGYDNNKTMRKGRYRVYGSNGALPLWINFAKVIIDKKEYAKELDTLDLKVLSRKEWGLRFNRKKANPLMVDLPRGLVVRNGMNSDYELWGTTDLDKTGETFTNEFVLGSSVKAIVYAPFQPGAKSWQPLKRFSLFSVRKDDDEGTTGMGVSNQNLLTIQSNAAGSEKAVPEASEDINKAAPRESTPSDMTKLPTVEEASPPDTEVEGGSGSKGIDKKESDNGYTEDDLW